jgi:hypothetical protein
MLKDLVIAADQVLYNLQIANTETTGSPNLPKGAGLTRVTDLKTFSGRRVR